jgi:hypothetical protein
MQNETYKENQGIEKGGRSKVHRPRKQTKLQTKTSKTTNRKRRGYVKVSFLLFFCENKASKQSK